MDVFIEQLIRRKKTNADYTKQSLTLVGGVFAVIAGLVITLNLALIIGQLGFLVGSALVCGIGYGTFRLILTFNIEYEYILTNGELDVDKIVAKRDRKRLLNIEAKNFSEFGRLTQDIIDAEYDTRIYAYSDLSRPDICYATFETQEMGKALLVFNPNEDFVSRLLPYLPMSAKKDFK